jgi:general secretion pathway protein H
MVPTDRKGEPVQQLTSPAGRDDDPRERGFTLIEVVCVVAILAILAAMIMPRLPRGTSRARLESYAIATAALLKADRNAAIRTGTSVATEIDAGSRLVRSGASERFVRVPDDVDMDALLAARCSERQHGRTIRFFSSGMSCGGVIALSRQNVSYEIRVNWMTGGVEVAARNRT